ncbi:MAG: hypothetical protein MZV70_60880 [Desulfobacterales bacterium]|nr:hypothetical protein [Desulfobacterales bacterium]
MRVFAAGGAGPAAVHPGVRPRCPGAGQRRPSRPASGNSRRGLPPKRSSAASRPCSESRKSGISAFAQRQKDYLRERETEFKEIIDILTRAMVAMDSDNRDYNRSILEQSRRIEDITRLDDIKRRQAGAHAGSRATCARRCARRNPATSPRSSPCRSRLRC